ncbi:hypothetical protein DVH24_002498 [Malus domestica]|uniref:Uncharacterized protein n=1 Tax=Malus domestica TaxID=3750 RepID=A0A498IQ67_MALDO|nr:hypothetical protein DVH24_002498 [Malus domestica]
MSTLEIEQPYPKPTHSLEPDTEKDDVSPIEQVRLTVTNTDDPTLPVWTFRITEPLIITQITVQVSTLPIVLPTKTFHVPGFGSRTFSLNPGPFNVKEHVLITIFANAGSAFGAGSAYAVGIVNIIKAFYHWKISLLAGWLLIITTQCDNNGVHCRYWDTAGLGWAFKEVCCGACLYVVAQYTCTGHCMRKMRATFTWYAFPGYLFTTLTNISWVCWLFSKSVTAQQIGSGMRGLGVGSLTLDWSAVASFLFSPLICPFLVIVNVFARYALILYLVIPIAYWGLDSYSAQKFPIFSSHLFTAEGQDYNITAIVDDKFQLDIPKYEEQGRIHLSMFFALTYGFGFVTIASTLTHVALFYGR